MMTSGRYSKRIFVLKNQFHNPDYIDDEDVSFLENLIIYHKENCVKIAKLDISLLDGKYQTLFSNICNHYPEINQTNLKTELYKTIDLEYKGEEKHRRNVKEQIIEYLRHKQGDKMTNRRVELFLKLATTTEPDDLRGLCKKIFFAIKSPRKINFRKTKKSLHSSQRSIQILNVENNPQIVLENISISTTPIQHMETLFYPYLPMIHPKCGFDYDKVNKMIKQSFNEVTPKSEDKEFKIIYNNGQESFENRHIPIATTTDQLSSKEHNQNIELKSVRTDSETLAKKLMRKFTKQKERQSVASHISSASTNINFRFKTPIQTHEPPPKETTPIIELESIENDSKIQPKKIRRKYTKRRPSTEYSASSSSVNINTPFIASTKIHKRSPKDLNSNTDLESIENDSEIQLKKIRRKYTKQRDRLNNESRNSTEIDSEISIKKLRRQYKKQNGRHRIGHIDIPLTSQTKTIEPSSKESSVILEPIEFDYEVAEKKPKRKYSRQNGKLSIASLLSPESGNINIPLTREIKTNDSASERIELDPIGIDCAIVEKKPPRKYRSHKKALNTEYCASSVLENPYIPLETTQTNESSSKESNQIIDLEPLEIDSEIRAKKPRRTYTKSVPLVPLTPINITNVHTVKPNETPKKEYEPIEMDCEIFEVKPQRKYVRRKGRRGIASAVPAKAHIPPAKTNESNQGIELETCDADSEADVVKPRRKYTKTKDRVNSGVRTSVAFLRDTTVLQRQLSSLQNSTNRLSQSPSQLTIVTTDSTQSPAESASKIECQLQMINTAATFTTASTSSRDHRDRCLSPPDSNNNQQEVIEISDDDNDNTPSEITHKEEVQDIDKMIDFLIHRCSIQEPDLHSSLLSDNRMRVELNGFLVFVNISIRLSLKIRLDFNDKKIFDCVFISSIIIGLSCSVYIDTAGINIVTLSANDLAIAQARLSSVQVPVLALAEKNGSHSVLINPDISRLIQMAVVHIESYQTSGYLHTSHGNQL